MQEENIIFGGEKKLREAIREADRLFNPVAISVHATCPIGLIGDDIHQIAKEMSEELGKQVLAFSCEGYKGVSQSAGHHIANNGLINTNPYVGEERLCWLWVGPVLTIISICLMILA